MTAYSPDDFEPLPPHPDPRLALRRALPALRPAERVTVTEAAEREMKVKIGDQWQPFRRDVTPYMVEPTDMAMSRKYRGLVFCGPSQSGKTQMLMSQVAYTAAANPGRVALYQMTRDAAQEFERNKLSPMIHNSPDLRARLSKGRGGDQQYQKMFTGGTHLTLDWPTITKLSSATIRLVLGTDYDHFPESIDGEGDAYSLMRARTRTFMSRGMVVVESSPAAPIKDESWRAEHPHDCPPVKYGVLSLYPSGTRGRWYWPCPECGAEFEPAFKRLVYPDSVDPVEAGEAAVMRCPHCQETFGHHLKRDLNAAGRWMHLAKDSLSIVPVTSDDVRRTDMLSYWLDGAAAAFASWAELVTQYRQAILKFEATGDEESLKTAMNTGQAQPYLPRAASAENEVTLQGLRDKVSGVETPKSVAPAWTRYVTVSIDTQGTRWDVGVTAWGENGRHQPIDRFDIVTPPDGAPDAADRSVRPFDVAEDWEALVQLETMVWPVEGANYGLRAVALAVDMHGGGSTTENAYRFYRGRRRAGSVRFWYLTRGEGGGQSRRPDRVWMKAPERVSQTARKKRRVASDIQIMFMATDRLKDACATSLRMVEDGENRCLVPEWMPEALLIEYTAERRTAKGWEKRPGMVRNESLDHLVQARALHIYLGGEKINWASPGGWCLGGAENVNAVVLAENAAPTPTPAHAETSAVVSDVPRRAPHRLPRRLF